MAVGINIQDGLVTESARNEAYELYPDSLKFDTLSVWSTGPTKDDDLVHVYIGMKDNKGRAEKLMELADSIKEFGVLEPIIVTKSVKGYEIVAGERRKKASELAGLETIPAIIKDFSDEEMMQIAVLENIQREDLTAIEEAEAYSKLIKSLNITQEELAKKIGKSRSYITNMLGLLRLPNVVKKDILDGFISMGHAKVLSKIANPEQILFLAEKIKKDSISVRELEELANNPVYKRKNEIVKVKEPNAYGYVEDALTEIIGNKIKIKNKKIVIPFNSDKDLERILEILKIEVKVD